MSLLPKQVLTSWLGQVDVPTKSDLKDWELQVSVSINHVFDNVKHFSKQLLQNTALLLSCSCSTRP